MDTERFQLILDIDGVLVPYNGMKKRDADGEHAFMESAVNALNSIITYYQADLIMVSSWNTKFADEAQYAEFLRSRGVIVNGLTFGDHTARYAFVDELIASGLKDYLIIDDECHGYLKSCMTKDNIEYKRIVRTNRNRCLDEYDAAFHCNWVKYK